MKKIQFVLIFALVACLSCNDDSAADVTQIEGYWEIESVQLPNGGGEKDYDFNNTIDYIELKDSLSGFRKKLTPQLDGTFLTTDDAEKFVLKIENDSLNVYYSTSFSSWKETILFADQERMEVINANKVRYLYKRYEPLNLD